MLLASMLACSAATAAEPSPWTARATFDSHVPSEVFADEGDPYRLGLGVGYALHPTLDATLDVVISYIQVAAYDFATGGETVATGFDLGLRWVAPLPGPLAPYLEAQAGMQRANPESFPAKGSHENFTLVGGAGLRLALGARWALRGGMRYMHVSNANLLPKNNGYDGFLASGGLELRF